MADTGWRKNKYGGLFNINDIKDKATTNEYMNNKIRNANVKTETLSENMLGYERKHKYIKENKNVVGEAIYYNKEGTPYIENINVHKDYRRKGHATTLLKEIQKELGDQEINFGILTEDGKKLINKVGYNVKEQKGKYDKTYKGKIRR